MILSLIFISTLLQSNCIVQVTSTVIEKEIAAIDVGSIFFSGLNTTSDLAYCALYCTKFKNASTIFYPMLSISGVCFCTSKDELLTGGTFTGSTADVADCLLTDASNCTFDDGYRNDAYEVIYDTYLFSPSKFEVPLEVNNLKYAIGDAKVASKSKDRNYKAKFAFDADWMSQREINTGYSRYFIHTGYVKSFFEWYIQLEWPKTFLHYFEAKCSHMDLQIPNSATYDKKFVIFVIGDGTNLTTSISTNLMAPSTLTYANLIADINMVSSIGSASHEFEWRGAAYASYGTLSKRNGFYIIKETVSMEKSILKGILLFAAKSGPIRFAVLRPQCAANEIYSIEKQSCGTVEEDFVSGDNLMENKYISNVISSSVKIIHVFIMDMTKNFGDYYFDLLSGNIEMEKGDMIGIEVHADSGALYAMKKDSNHDGFVDSSYIDTNALPNTEYTVVPLRAMFPSFDVYFAKTFNLKYHLPSANDVMFNAQVQNLLSAVIYSKLPKIQKMLWTFEFKTDFPKTSGFYNWNADESVDLILNHNPAENLTFTFRTTPLNLTFSKLNHGNFSQSARFFGPGNHTFYAEASNGVSIMRTNVTFEIEAMIELVEIDCLNETWITNQFNYTIFIFGGTNVMLHRDSGNGHLADKGTTRFTEPILTLTNLTFKADFSTCGKYNMKAIAENKVTPFPILATKDVIIYCPLQIFEISTSPVATANGDILVSSLSPHLELNIYLVTGSFVEYNISWGDGTFFIYKSSSPSPEAIELKHTYAEEGTYLLETNLQSFTATESQTFPVKVRRCPPPHVNFPYGTKQIPLNITREADHYLIAEWFYGDPFCELKIENKFFATNWTLTKPDKSKYITTPSKGKQSVAYLLETNRMDAGFFELELKMEYLDDILLYTAYFIIREAPLYAAVSSGFFQEIPIYKTINGQQDFYQFQLNAEGSFDPDRSNGDISFEWTCQVLSTKQVVDAAKVNINRNMICLSESEENIPTNFGGLTSEIKIDTSLFLKNIQYEINVYLYKGSRNSKTTSRVSVIPTSNPSILMTCIENCLEKIDIMKQVKFKYECYSCQPNDLLVGKWSIIDEDSSAIISPDAFLTPTTSLDLTIKTNKLKPSRNFKFQYEVKFASDPTSKTLLVIKRSTADIPNGGTCEALVSEGYALEEKFGFECKEWKSNEGTLTYDFQFKDSNKKEYKTSTTNSEDFISFTRNRISPFVYNVSFPIGNPKDNYKIQILIKITNKFKTFVVYDKIMIKVYPPHMKAHATSAEQALENVLTKGPAKPDDSLNVLQYVLTSQVLEDQLEEGYKQFENGPKPNALTGIISEESKKAKEQALNKKKHIKRKAKSKNIEAIEKVNVKSRQDITNIGSALQSFSDDSAENFESQTVGKGVGILDKVVHQYSLMTENSDSEISQLDATPLIASISNFLKIESQENRKINPFNEISDDMLPDEVTTSLLQTTVSPLMSTTVNSNATTIDTTPTTTAQTANPTTSSSTNQDTTLSTGNLLTTTAIPLSNEQKRNESMRNTERLLAMLDIISNEFAKKKMVEEYPTRIETDNLAVAVEVNTAIHLTNTFMRATSGSGFQIGNLTKWSSTVNQVFRVQNLHFEQNPLFWFKESENVKTKIEGMSFQSRNGTKIDFKSPDDDIIKIILATNVSDKSHTVALAKPLQYVSHSVEVSKGCNLIVRLKSLNDYHNATTLIFYVQYGKQPSKSDYDILVNLTTSTGLVAEYSNAPTKVVFSGITHHPDRQSYILQNSDGSLLFYNFSGYTYANYLNATTKNYLHFVFTYEGPLPPIKNIDNIYTFDILEYRSTFNYSFNSQCTSCMFANQTSDAYEETGLKVAISETTGNKLVCKTNHLTMFGGSYVAPNPLPPLSFSALKDGYVLLVTVCVVLLLWLIATVFTRKHDKKDLTKIGVSPLIDNKPQDRYLYEITINTGSRPNAKTDSNVFLKITGSSGCTNTRIMKDPNRKTFQVSSSDTFIMRTSESLGDLLYVKVWHDNSGGDWYLRSIQVTDLQSDKDFLFLATRWLALDKNDGMIECVLPLANEEQLKDFNYLFTTKARKDFTDAHVWYSIVARPPRSLFTRTQRFAVAISLLLTSMTASVMFYDAIPKGNAVNENRIGDFKFTWSQVYVAIISACITLPINLILVGLFQSIRPKIETCQKEESPTQLEEVQVISVSEAKSSRMELKLQSSSGNVNQESGKVDTRQSIAIHNFGYQSSNDDLSQQSSSSQQSVQQPMTPSSSQQSGQQPMTSSSSQQSGQQPMTSSSSQQSVQQPMTSTEYAVLKNEKKKFSLPHWMLIPTWVLCFIVNLGCGFVIVWYGMALGNKKSLDWLASVTICLFQDIILMQPFKVLIIALFVALVTKKVDEHEKLDVEKQAKDLAKDESWLDAVVDGLDDRIDTEDMGELDTAKLDWMREIRLKEVKMQAIVREMILYLFFTLVVFLIGYLSREKSTFYQTNGLEELLSLRVREDTNLEDNQQFQNILSYSDFWPWMDNLFLDEVFPKRWYNLDAAYNDTPDVRDFPGKVFLNDLSSKIVNGIRIRQVRIKPDTCTHAPDVVDIMTIDCAGEFSGSNEDSRHFKDQWSRPYDESENKPPLTPLNKPWRYQTWEELDGYPIWAELYTYSGGGYVAEIFPKWQNKEILKSLKEKNWIDRHTRAVIIEFAIYNGGTTYFTSVTIVVEFPPGGGAIPYFQSNTFQLYRFAQHNKFFVIFCEVLYFILMIIFSYREFRLIQKMKWAYFKEFWNVIEISNILLTLTAFGFYIYREILANDLLTRLPDKKPNKFINFQFAAMLGLSLTYIIALICFFVTLKFIKLLRFNRRISLLSLTMKRAFFPLLMFGICFGVVLAGVISATRIIFGAHLYGYRDYYRTTASIIGLLLGKFSYEQFEEGNRTLGPIFFMAFNIMVNLVIMNMMISILDDSIHEVQEEVLEQENDYEIVDYIVAHLKDWFGLGKSKSLGEREWEERSNAEEGSNSNVTSRRNSDAMSSINGIDQFRYLYDRHFCLDDHDKASTMAITDDDVIEDEWSIFLTYFNLLSDVKKCKGVKKNDDIVTTEDI